MADVAVFVDDKEGQKWLKRLQKKVDQTKGASSQYAAILSSVVFQDIMGHFENEQGPKGPWAKWSKVYAEHMEKVGKGNNKVLQDSGRLRQAFTPNRYRKVSEGILWYNPAKTKDGFPYAAGHDEGIGRLPVREFMYLSNSASLKIEKLTLDWILSDK